MTINIEMQDVKVDPIRIVEPRVQLIGYTHYIPPFDVDSPHDDDLQLSPHEFATDGESIIEFAGRGCYRSWDRPSEKTATIEGYLSNILSQKHFSVLRHASATFYVTGVSRSFTHEVVTHAHIARSQESQRYVPADKINAVLPALIRDWPGIKDKDGNYNPSEFSEMVRYTRNTYAKLVRIFEANGVKGKRAREAARGVLPNCVETRLTMTGNFQTWMEFLTKRHQPHAEAEMQIIAELIWFKLIQLAPSIFDAPVRQIWDPEYAKREKAKTVDAWTEASEAIR